MNCRTWVEENASLKAASLECSVCSHSESEPYQVYVLFKDVSKKQLCKVLNDRTVFTGVSHTNQLQVDTIIFHSENQ